ACSTARAASSTASSAPTPHPAGSASTRCSTPSPWRPSSPTTWASPWWPTRPPPRTRAVHLPQPSTAAAPTPAPPLLRAGPRPPCHPCRVNGPEIRVEFAPQLLVFLPQGRATGTLHTGADGVSGLGPVVESLGLPLTEVGRLLVEGREVPVSYLPGAGESVTV